MKIIKAEISHLEALVLLFDGYRVFYKQESDYEAAKIFLQSRLKNRDSVIYIAYINDVAVGFTQLYGLFSSVAMQPIYLLNDLYIDSKHRNKGIGAALIEKAKALCIEKNYNGLIIQTAFDNPAQHLYQRLGFQPDSDLSFFWTCADK
ncbi:GNAT family N-acetyltransferase [Lacinutrix iliipiscaria]|uniref:GNAT family N-acetyltransferase n=1 Tax=Lacinutrix iliipiscaria TaxID=1230532 RepID=A0ABW5WME7_9FLAO